LSFQGSSIHDRLTKKSPGHSTKSAPRQISSAQLKSSHKSPSPQQANAKKTAAAAAFVTAAVSPQLAAASPSAKPPAHFALPKNLSMMLEADLDTLDIGPLGTSTSLNSRATAVRHPAESAQERALAAEVVDIRERREVFEIEADLKSVHSAISSCEQIIEFGTTIGIVESRSSKKRSAEEDHSTSSTTPTAKKAASAPSSASHPHASPPPVPAQPELTAPDSATIFLRNLAAPITAKVLLTEAFPEENIIAMRLQPPREGCATQTAELVFGSRYEAEQTLLRCNGKYYRERKLLMSIIDLNDGRDDDVELDAEKFIAAPPPAPALTASPRLSAMPQVTVTNTNSESTATLVAPRIGYATAASSLLRSASSTVTAPTRNGVTGFMARALRSAMIDAASSSVEASKPEFSVNLNSVVPPSNSTAEEALLEVAFMAEAEQRNVAAAAPRVKAATAPFAMPEEDDNNDVNLMAQVASGRRLTVKNSQPKFTVSARTASIAWGVQE
jgi:hypothetical protein